MNLCVGGDGFDGLFAGSDDGCAANGGSSSSIGLSSSNMFAFSPTTTEVAVWDHITINSGAGFGSLGQTFTQVPEPSSMFLIGSVLGLFARRWFK